MTGTGVCAAQHQVSRLHNHTAADSVDSQRLSDAQHVMPTGMRRDAGRGDASATFCAPKGRLKHRALEWRQGTVCNGAEYLLQLRLELNLGPAWLDRRANELEVLGDTRQRRSRSRLRDDPAIASTPRCHEGSHGDRDECRGFARRCHVCGVCGGVEWWRQIFLGQCWYMCAGVCRHARESV